DGRVAGSPRIFLVVVDRIVVAERLGEAPDGPFLHLVERGGRGSPDRVLVEHSDPFYRPAGSSKTVSKPGSAEVSRGAAFTPGVLRAGSPAFPPLIPSSISGSASPTI